MLSCLRGQLSCFGIEVPSIHTCLRNWMDQNLDVKVINVIPGITIESMILILFSMAFDVKGGFVCAYRSNVNNIDIEGTKRSISAVMN